MKNIAIVTTVVTTGLLSSTAFAETIYDEKNIYNTNATLADLQSEATRLNTYTHGNSVAIGHLNNVKADKTEVQAVSNRVTQNTNTINQQGVQIQGNTKETVRLEQVKADRSELKAVEGVVVNQGNTLTQHNKTLVNHQGRIETLEGVSNEYGARLDAYEASSNDLSSSLANYKASTDSRLAGLESDVQQAKEGNAVALAVAAQQFCTDLDCGFQTAASASTIHGKQAIAVGMGGAVSENLFLNAAFSKSGKTQGGAVSATYRWR